MARIFEKIPASGEKCLILDPREALVYPLAFGDWTEIRVSAAVSFTSISDDNGIMPSGYVSASTNAKNCFLFGLISGESGSLPFSNGTSYIGFGNPTGKFLSTTSTDFAYNAITINNNFSPNPSVASKLMDGFSSVNDRFFENPFLTTGILSRFDTRFFSLSTGNADADRFNSIMNFSLPTGYAKIIGARFELNNKGLSGQHFSIGFFNNGANSSFTTFPIERLKQSNQNIGKNITGLYYNSNLTPTGSPISVPDKFIIQSPFQNSRLRIHALLIEKYQ
jgi:hypothetical protein